MNSALVASVAALATLLGAACGAAGEGTVGTSAEDEPAAAVEAEVVAFGEALAQIRGHHTVALELYEEGDTAGALVHARHPLEETLAVVEPELEEHDAPLAHDLLRSLEAAEEAVESESSSAGVEAAFEDSASLTDDAGAAVAGRAASSEASYVGSVVASLLSTAAHEYEESVGDGDVVAVDEYQDGYGFLGEAESLYEGMADEVESAAIEEAEEIEDAFGVLRQAMPAPAPPDQVAAAEDVGPAAELVGHELEEVIGARPAVESDPEEVAAEIEERLSEVVAAYEAGDAGGAAELAAEAYLESYEVIEAEVIARAPAVNRELEPLLGAELRRRIEAGAPASEIRDMVTRAELLLDDALDALLEQE